MKSAVQPKSGLSMPRRPVWAYGIAPESNHTSMRSVSRVIFRPVGLTRKISST